ncbi:MAG: hypothetical protein M3O01_14935 [Pseudomonadota bacterium]|nr:hypothetical protein [Pseudomonadota bacterium]
MKNQLLYLATVAIALAGTVALAQGELVSQRHAVVAAQPAGLHGTGTGAGLLHFTR